MILKIEKGDALKENIVCYEKIPLFLKSNIAMLNTVSVPGTG